MEPLNKYLRTVILVATYLSVHVLTRPQPGSVFNIPFQVPFWLTLLHALGCAALTAGLYYGVDVGDKLSVDGFLRY